jgi:hypothetical protein
LNQAGQERLRVQIDVEGGEGGQCRTGRLQASICVAREQSIEGIDHASGCALRQRCRELCVVDGHRGLDGGIAGKGINAAEHSVKDHADGKDIGPCVKAPSG